LPVRPGGEPGRSQTLTITGLQVMHYTIPVRGAATRQPTVDITVHGPTMTQARQLTPPSNARHARPPGPSPRQVSQAYRPR
jgi:hypothetical protein